MSVRLALVGATGLVGSALLECLEARGVTLAELHPLASARSLGQRVGHGGRELPVLELERFDFARSDVVIFCTGSEVAQAHAPRAREAGCRCIDLSLAARLNPEVPLIMPAINAALLAALPPIVASPCAAGIQLVRVLHPLRSAGLERVAVTALVPASVAGREAIETLARESVEALSGRGEAQDNVTPVAFRSLPEVGEVVTGGHTREELALASEARRLLELPQLPVRTNLVRVPVFYGQALLVHVALQRPLTAGAARELLRTAAGVSVLQAPRGGGYPTVPSEAANRDTVCVGRIREYLDPDAGLNLWVAADNVRTGAANAVEILEALAGRTI